MICAKENGVILYVTTSRVAPQLWYYDSSQTRNIHSTRDDVQTQLPICKLFANEKNILDKSCMVYNNNNNNYSFLRWCKILYFTFINRNAIKKRVSNVEKSIIHRSITIKFHEYKVWIIFMMQRIVWMKFYCSVSSYKRNLKFNLCMIAGGKN